MHKFLVTAAVVSMVAVIAWFAYLITFLREIEEKQFEPETFFYQESDSLSPYAASRLADVLAASLMTLRVGAYSAVVVAPGAPVRYGVVTRQAPDNLPAQFATLQRQQLPKRVQMVAGVLAQGWVAWLSALPIARHSITKYRSAKGYASAPVMISDDGEVILFSQVIP